MKMTIVTRTTIGACLWLLTLQYFAAEAVAISGWQGSYSLSRNYISDLGAIGCGVVVTGLSEKASLCSPLHSLMNGSFILQGLLITGGTLLVWSFFPRGILWTISLVYIAASGVGVLMVGLAPEDTNQGPHVFGAVENFFCCNAGMAIMGAAMAQWRRSTRHWGFITLIVGIVGLIGLGLMAMRVDLGLGVGGVERFVAYPFPLWLAVMGVYILNSGGAWSDDDQIQTISKGI